MGMRKGNCETVEVPGDIDKIKVYADDFVEGISWHSKTWSKEYNIPKNPNFIERRNIK